MDQDFNLSEALKARGSNQKNYAEWLGQTSEGLTKRKGKMGVEAICAFKTYVAGLSGVSFELKKNKFVISIDLD